MQGNFLDWFLFFVYVIGSFGGGLSWNGFFWLFFEEIFDGRDIEGRWFDGG